MLACTRVLLLRAVHMLDEGTMPRLFTSEHLRVILDFAHVGLRAPHLVEISLFLVDYPFADRLYPGALDLVSRLRRRGMTVILSDGDLVALLSPAGAGGSPER